MTQDGEQRKTSKWTFTKYDQLDRPVLTGIFTDAESRDQEEMQTNFRYTNSGVMSGPRLMKKMIHWFIFIGLTGIVAFNSCSAKKSILPIEFNDPYLNAFRGKNIKYVILERQDRQSIPDTIELDKAGNIIRIMSWWSKELRSYDSQGFLQRVRQQSDITLNYVLRYSLKGDTLQQTWREINSPDWNLNTDTVSNRDHVILFIYDSKGRIDTEIEYGGSSIKYVYVGDLLVKKARPTRYPLKFFHGWQYDYDNNSVLKRIVRTFESQEQEITTFSGGLPDSGNSVESGGKYKYRYVYYM